MYIYTDLTENFFKILYFCSQVVRTPQMWRAGWGALLRERLAPLSHWAERQGLELAADCHLATIHQCAHLLQVIYM